MYRRRRPPPDHARSSDAATPLTARVGAGAPGVDHHGVGVGLRRCRQSTDQFTPREVIHAQNPWSGGRSRIGQGADQPDQRHPVHRSGQPLGQPSAGAAAQRKCHLPRQAAEPQTVDDRSDWSLQEPARRTSSSNKRRCRRRTATLPDARSSPDRRSRCYTTASSPRYDAEPLA
jgi:hypothetical protein